MFVTGLVIGSLIGAVIGVAIMAILNSNRYYGEKKGNHNGNDKAL